MGFIEKVVKRLKKEVKHAQRPDKLIKWQKRLETAKGGQDLALMDKREYLYLGDRRVDKNVNATTDPTKMSNNLYNIIFEFIESMKNGQIPQAQIKSKREGFEGLAQMIADSINSDMKESNIETIDDQNERITPLQGFSIVEVAWNPNFKHHLYRGEIELYGRHPKQLVPQPKVYNLQKMDYFFILSDVTQDYVERRYKKDMSGENEQYPENTRLFTESQSASGGVVQRSAGDQEEEPLTEIVCWYKDADDDICKFVWINDDIMEDLPKYFYRRINGVVTEEETLQEDVIGWDGKPIAAAGETVPYFIPTRYPVSVRINVPRNFSFGGQSDCDVIRDQQDSIKRVVHKMEEKIVKGGTIITSLDDHSAFDKITDEIYQMIKGNQAELMAIKTLDLTADITKDLLFVQEQYRMAQSMLGITNSFQGKEDTTAQSGKAKQIQVQQASGRMQSKAFNKFIHYKEIFEIIFEHKLALYDELRAYLTQDMNGQDAYGEFDKYKFLQRDKAGKLYYNTDFIFGSDGSIGLPKDPMFLYEQAMALFTAQAIDATQLFTILEALQFPQAAKIKKQIEERMNLQGQVEQMGQQMQQMNAASQQEHAIQEEVIKQLTEALHEAQKGDMQAVHDTLAKLEEGQQNDHQQAMDMQNQQSQADMQSHQMEMDRQKMALEAKKVEASKVKVGAGK